jgi:hypothetical protein
VISPHQLIVQLLDAHLKAGVLPKKLSVALLNVLDSAVLDLHLVGVLRGRDCRIPKCPHRPSSAPARTDGTGGHSTRKIGLMFLATLEDESLLRGRDCRILGG